MAVISHNWSCQMDRQHPDWPDRWLSSVTIGHVRWTDSTLTGQTDGCHQSQLVMSEGQTPPWLARQMAVISHNWSCQKDRHHPNWPHRWLASLHRSMCYPYPWHKQLTLWADGHIHMRHATAHLDHISVLSVSQAPQHRAALLLLHTHKVSHVADVSLEKRNKQTKVNYSKEKALSEIRNKCCSSSSDIAKRWTQLKL